MIVRRYCLGIYLPARGCQIRERAAFHCFIFLLVLLLLLPCIYIYVCAYRFWLCAHIFMWKLFNINYKLHRLSTTERFPVLAWRFAFDVFPQKCKLSWRQLGSEEAEKEKEEEEEEAAIGDSAKELPTTTTQSDNLYSRQCQRRPFILIYVTIMLELISITFYGEMQITVVIIISLVALHKRNQRWRLVIVSKPPPPPPPPLHIPLYSFASRMLRYARMRRLLQK